MSPLLRKEARLLLPAWIGALVAATLPLWPWEELRDMLPIIFGAAVTVLALSPFGQEMSHGTFGLLLVQPENRRRFWRIKTRLLAAALVSVWSLFMFCLANSWDRVGHTEWSDWFMVSALMTLLAFSGGLWSTLLLRDSVPSLLCTCLVPAGICMAALLTVGHWVNIQSDLFSVILYCLLASYAVAGVFWARRLFLDAQDVPWTGGQVSLKTGRGVSLRWLAFKFKGRQNRWTALIKKELQLQEVTMFLIPVLALLHLALLAINHFAPFSTELLFVAIPVIWLASVPFVIGCVAAAEERRLNTLDSLLCLPVSKRASFAVKLVVALVLGTVLGGVVPWALEHLGEHRAGPFSLDADMEIAATITGVAFYASTMSRGLLQAIPTALCVPAVIGIIITLCLRFLRLFDDERLLLQSGYLFPLVSCAVMTPTLIWLSFRNYKSLQIGWRVWIGNLTRSCAALGCASLVTVMIFNRFWEVFLPLEPVHGPARLSGAGRPDIAFSKSGPCVLLPDGRLWMKSSGSFAPGSNWTEIADSSALQSDGTLWRIPGKSGIQRIGSDSDWKKIAAKEDLYLAVKQDGTLWGWGRDHNQLLSKQSHHPSRDFYIDDPVRVGKDSDWVDVFLPNNSQAIGIKRDGSSWKWGIVPHGPDGRSPGATNRNQLVRWNLEGTNWAAMAGAQNLTLGIRRDGSLWASSDYMPSPIFGQNVDPGRHSDALRVGDKSDWVALSGTWQFTAVEADGTLWTMDYKASKHPSKYADWVAVADYNNVAWALAKDGTLSCWDVFDANEYSTFMGRVMLRPSRRPTLSVNILNQHQ